MAKTIATITGTALVPGVSRNGRWYKPEHVAEAVRSARERIASGQKPMVMLTFHGADDNSREIAASLTDVTLNESGGADFAAGITDTGAGWDIARLADSTDGKPAHLKTVSIRGAWTGKVRKERGPGGQLVETADGVELDGIDFTRKPGVTGAEIKTFAWVKDDATETAETTERVLITESVQEAEVSVITEETTPAAGVTEAGAQTGAPPGTTYADPGYLKDKKKRYPLNGEKRIRAAWSYINQKDNAAQYTAAQLKRVKGRIKAAMGRIGAKVTDEGWMIWPAEYITETGLAEDYGMGDGPKGSFSVNATNGPLTVCLSSYCIDPADLEMILQAAACAAAGALKALDPDLDADLDVPGAGAEDTDSDMDNGDGVEDLVRRLMSAVRGESAEPLEDVLAEARALTDGTPAVIEAAVTESPAAIPDAASQETEAPVSETTIQEAAGASAAAPSYSQADLDGAVSKALAARQEARKARKAAKKAKAAESAGPAAEAAVAESAAPDLEKLVADGIAAALQAQGLTETTEQKVARLVTEGVTRAKQEMTAAGGGPDRKGLVTEHSPARTASEGVPADYPVKDGELLPMEKWSEANRRAVGTVLQQAFLGSRAEVL